MNLTRLNYAILTLVPKQEVAKSPLDFRLLSLIHSCIKLISKVLANILQPLLKDLTSATQAAYIKGRFIMDNILCANEILLKI